MRKGKLGISLGFYAVLALVLAFLQQTTLCILLLGFVLVAERDEWASRQVMQAAFLSLFGTVVNEVLDILNVFKEIPIVGSVFSGIFGLVSSIISLLILIFVIIALTRVVKGRDAGIPVMSTLADRAFGVVAQKVYQPYPQQPQQPYGANPAYPQQPAQPVQPQQPVDNANQAPKQ